MLLHRGFPRRQRPTDSSARSRSRLRERPVGASESAPQGGHPTSTARRPARSERPAEKAWGVSSDAAQPLALSRWRRGHMHFSPERARAVRRAPARPEWSVASDAEGGSGERGGPSRTHLSSRPRRSVSHSPSWRTQKGRGRLGRSPTPQAPQARGAQRRPRERSERGPARLRLARSRDVERPRAFVSVASRSQ